MSMPMGNYIGEGGLAGPSVANTAKGGFCEHNRPKSRCRDCGGSSFCEHGRRRSHCKQCGGKTFCEHQRQRSRCKECGGSGICEHQNERSKCKLCSGAAICKHDRVKSYCKRCVEEGEQGGSICKHQREWSKCKECNGSGLCKHKQRIGKCKECRAGLPKICEHKLIRNRCKECRGPAVPRHPHEQTHADPDPSASASTKGKQAEQAGAPSCDRQKIATAILADTSLTNEDTSEAPTSAPEPLSRRRKVIKTISAADQGVRGGGGGDTCGFEGKVFDRGWRGNERGVGGVPHTGGGAGGHRALPCSEICGTLADSTAADFRVAPPLHLTSSPLPIPPTPTH